VFGVSLIFGGATKAWQPAVLTLNEGHGAAEAHNHAVVYHITLRNLHSVAENLSYSINTIKSFFDAIRR
jgi:hypothetical protein